MRGESVGRGLVSSLVGTGCFILYSYTSLIIYANQTVFYQDPFSNSLSSLRLSPGVYTGTLPAAFFVEKNK
jgi:hypothetical protein